MRYDPCVATQTEKRAAAAALGDAEIAPLAADLRIAVGELIRRLRAENLFPLTQTWVLGRLDREGAASVSDLAQALRVRPQSMAQTIGDLEAEGMVARDPDPNDRRRALVSLTPAGRARIEEDRAVREGWLVKALEELPEDDRETIERAVGILSRLAAADV
jgi:DNA-binding MarR family transcriptional regulator